MSPIVTSASFPLLSSTVSRLAAFVFAVTLFATTACAQGPAAPTNIAAKSAESNATAAVLQPYLGKWRPTSYSEGLNIGSLTISVDGLSYEVGGASVSYEVVRKTDEGVILRVTGRKPVDPSAAKAMAFSLETQTVDSFPPDGPTKTRQLLWIYRCGSIDSLVSGFAQATKATCSKNAYTR
jgi:hypothetical protein